MDREIKIAELDHKLNNINKKLKKIEESDLKPFKKYQEYLKVIKQKREVEKECISAKELLDLS